jgi:hypothetical protein
MRSVPNVLVAEVRLGMRARRRDPASWPLAKLRVRYGTEATTAARQSARIGGFLDRTTTRQAPAGQPIRQNAAEIQ